jgi:hypothetical protein
MKITSERVPHPPKVKLSGRATPKNVSLSALKKTDFFFLNLKSQESSEAKVAVVLTGRLTKPK